MKILAAYATRAGSTAEVAAEIGRLIESKGGCEVDVHPVEQHRDALGRVPVALFTVCLRLKEDTEENRSTVAAYLDPVREVVQPVDVGLFAGAMDYSKLPFILRLLMKAMKAPQGDFRDWEGICAWAGQVRDRRSRCSRMR